MILIAYGLPKSASTFVFFTLANLAAGAGSALWARLEQRMPAGKQAPYQPQVDEAFLTLARERWPERELLPIKTHDELRPFVAREIATGRIKACASFRDPRDTALALLDAGVRDREAGKDSFFAKLHTMDDAVRVLSNQIGRTMDWLAQPQVLPVPQKLVAMHPRRMAERLAEFAGTGDMLGDIENVIPEKDRKVEFNKGGVDRYKNEMAAHDRARIEAEFGEVIARFDALTGEIFARFDLPPPD